MSNNLIEGAGVILIREDSEQRIEHLFLKNKLTGYWEPPKGGIDKNEDFVHCALRELSEETGLSFDSKDILPIGPYSLNYKTGQSQKNILLYAIHHLKNGETVKLSDEHSDYIWDSHINLENLIANSYYSILKALNNDFTHIYSIYTLQRRFQKHTIKFFTELIKSFHLDKNIDWYLTGSVAALENTMNTDNKNLSDIDIVAISDDNSLNTNSLARFFNAKAEQELKTTCGINFIRYKETINASEPFWQYFNEYKLPLSTPKYQLNLDNSSIETDISYNVFRVLWYTLLRSNFCTSSSREYLYIKGIILLNYVGKRARFKGYKHLYLELEKNKKKESIQSPHEKALYDALAVKLNIKQIDKDWRQAFIDNALSSLDNIRNDSIELALSKTILDMETENYSRAAEQISRIVNSHLSLRSIEKIASALNLKEKNNLWTVLLIIRKTIWAEFFKYSGYKYDLYFNYFTKESDLSELKKEQLQQIFNNIPINYERQFIL